MDDDDDLENEDEKDPEDEVETEETISFSVYVQDGETGDPIENVRVTAIYRWTDDHQYTDESGYAYFERPMTAGGSAQTTLYVYGWDGQKEIGQYDVRDGDSYTTEYPSIITP